MRLTVIQMRAVRRRDQLFVHGFLALQLALPLAYYAGRGDRFDERFAWRMFSAERTLVRCTLRLAVDGRAVPLAGRFHEAWLSLAERGRPSVVEAIAARVCADEPGREVRARLRCETPTGPQLLEDGARDLCEASR